MYGRWREVCTVDGVRYVLYCMYTRSQLGCPIQCTVKSKSCPFVNAEYVKLLHILYMYSREVVSFGLYC